jgi:hypothetical protein
MSLPCFPQTAPSARPPSSLQRLPRVGFPPSQVLSRGSDSSSSLPPHFVAFAWRYLTCALSPVLPAAQGRFRLQRGSFPRPVLLARRRRALPGSWETPVPTCHRSWTPVGLRTSPYRSVSTAFCLRHGMGQLHHSPSFGAQSRGLQARCLRFAARVAPNTTQDSLPAGG